MGRLVELIKSAPLVFDESKADADFQDLLRVVGDGDDLAPLGDAVRSNPSLETLVKSIFGASPYLTGLIRREPELLQQIIVTDPEKACEQFRSELDASLQSAGDVNGAMVALRRFKRQIALFLAIVDLAEIWDVIQIVQTLSEAASVTLNGSIRFLLARAAARGDFFPANGEKPEVDSGYIVLGMGKLGAFELNYSSDIDIIVFFDPEKSRLKDGLEPQRFFVQVTKDLVKLMQERTADGYVFRTDLRLRPDPGATQVALSITAGMIYYESFGQNWERAAMIKARPVAGDVAAGEAFLAELAPFVWRKYLDYAAIADVHSIKRQIHAVKGYGEIAIKGHNIKVGRGGIREIEFFAQTQQLIAGGRQPSLRCRATLDALRELVRQEWIEAVAAEELSQAYVFLRQVEHRIQMIADEQTHSLPADDEGLTRLARFSGFEDVMSFSAMLRGHLETVQKHYEVLFEDVPGLTSEAGNMVFTGDDPDPETMQTLSNMGFEHPEQVIETVKKWHFGRYPATRSERARERLTEVQPSLLRALSDTVQPQAAFTAFDRFLKDLPAGVQLFSLIRNNPPLLNLIAGIMGTAPRLANVLSRRANLLDGVLDPGFFGDLPSDEALSQMIEEAMGRCRDYEAYLDTARDICQEQTFLIGARVLSGTVSASQAGGAFARLAGHLIDALQKRVAAHVSQIHGDVPGGSACVIAMGKLGGEEMTAASDLDLIVVYDFEPGATGSDGGRSLSVTQYFARLTQRLIGALTAPTASGSLYEVDMRLRPSGNAGPVATSFESFSHYHREKAWTWEHMALTRARVVSGPDDLRNRIAALITDVLCSKRDDEKLKADIHEMRDRIRAAKGGGTQWDLKQARGGLVDLEFISQYLQLRHAYDVPHILSRNTFSAFSKLRDAGLLDDRRAQILMDATNLYHSLTQVLRLCYEGDFDPYKVPEGLRALLAQSAGEVDFDRLQLRLNESLEAVGTLFDEILGQPTS